MESGGRGELPSHCELIEVMEKDVLLYLLASSTKVLDLSLVHLGVNHWFENCSN